VSSTSGGGGGGGQAKERFYLYNNPSENLV